MALSSGVRALCVALAGSLALVAGIAPPASAQQWTEVREATFKVEMRGLPEQAVQEVTVAGTGEVVDQIERTVTLGATEFFFSHTPYRKMPADLTPESRRRQRPAASSNPSAWHRARLLS